MPVLGLLADNLLPMTKEMQAMSVSKECQVTAMWLMDPVHHNPASVYRRPASQVISQPQQFPKDCNINDILGETITEGPGKYQVLKKGGNI